MIYTIAKESWVKEKQRECSKIEGAIGNVKTTYGLERLRYRISAEFEAVFHEFTN